VSRHVDLDDTSRCPLADRCAQCGSQLGLAVWTFDNVIGVGCITVCRRCAFGGTGSPLRQPQSWEPLIKAIWAHCAHLGIDLERMADAIDREAGRTPGGQGGAW
jgi:hypothetical protein